MYEEMFCKLTLLIGNNLLVGANYLEIEAFLGAINSYDESFIYL